MYKSGVQKTLSTLLASTILAGSGSAVSAQDINYYQNTVPSQVLANSSVRSIIGLPYSWPNNTAAVANSDAYKTQPNQSAFILSNFHYGRGASLDGEGQAIAVIGSTFLSDVKPELHEKLEDHKLVSFQDATQPTAFYLNHRDGISNGTFGKGEIVGSDMLTIMIGVQKQDKDPLDGVAEVPQVTEPTYFTYPDGTKVLVAEGGDPVQNMTPFVGLVNKAVGHQSTFLEAAGQDDLDASGNEKPFTERHIAKWTGYKRVADATLDALEFTTPDGKTHKSIFQANDWYRNRGFFAKNSSGAINTSIHGHGIELRPNTTSVFELSNSSSPTYQEVVDEQNSHSGGISFEEAIYNLTGDQNPTLNGRVGPYPSNVYAVPSPSGPDYSGNQKDPEQWDEYISALKTVMQKNTMIVGWALSNDVNDTSAPVMAALPEYDSTFEKTWLTVGGVSAPYQSNFDINTVSRQTGSCHETAAYCLFAGASVAVDRAKIVNDTNTKTEVLASDALALVGSAAAMVNQAFTIAQLSEKTDPDTGELISEDIYIPQLTANQVRNRLLATANKNFTAYKHADTEESINASACSTTPTPSYCVNFGTAQNPYWLTYNKEFGHGILDVKAAILPIGPLSSPTADAGGFSVVSSPHGGGFFEALDGTDTVAVDALGSPFQIPLASFFSIETDDAGDFLEEVERFALETSANVNSFSMGYAFNQENSASNDGLSFVSGSTASVAHGLGLAPEGDEVFSDAVSILPTDSDALSWGFVQHDADGGGTGTFAFVDRAGDQVESVGLAFNHTAPLGESGMASLGFVMKSDQTEFMGFKSAGESGGFTGMMGALNFSARWNVRNEYLGGLSNSASLFVNAEYGLGQGQGQAGMIQGFDTTSFSGYAAGIRFNQVLNETDALTLSVRQPLRIESGTAHIRHTANYFSQDDLDIQNIEVGLAPSSRQINIGARYGWNLSEATRINVGGYYSLNENHIAGEEGGAVMMALRTKF